MKQNLNFKKSGLLYLSLYQEPVNNMGSLFMIDLQGVARTEKRKEGCNQTIVHRATLIILLNCFSINQNNHIQILFYLTTKKSHYDAHSLG